MTNSSSDRLLSKKDFNKIVYYSLGCDFSWNYERQMHMSFTRMMYPVLRKLYKNDPDKMGRALQRHMEFFNTNPQMATFIAGVASAMEEENAKNPDFDESSINAVKVALMGPLAGVGDSIFLGTLRIIGIGIGTSLMMQGNWLGPLLYLLIYNSPGFIFRFQGVKIGYNMGTKFLQSINSSGLMAKIMLAASIVGMMVIGCMSKELVSTSLAIQIGSGDAATTLQSILDGIMPGILALGVTWLYYFLLKKNVNVILILIVTVIIGILGTFIGIF